MLLFHPESFDNFYILAMEESSKLVLTFLGLESGEIKSTCRQAINC